MDLDATIRSLYPHADPHADYALVDLADGIGPRIATWNAAKLGAQPDAAALASGWVKAQANAAGLTRLLALGALVEAKIAAGFHDPALGVLAIDDASQHKIIAQGASAGTALALATAANQPAPSTVYVLPGNDGSLVRADPQGCYLAAERVRAYVAMIDTNAATLAAQIAGGANPDITQGWP